MRLPRGARVAVIGAGPGGLVAAKHAISAGFAVSVFEASDDLGGQWHTGGEHSGIWPGMRTNTSRAMTAFSDFAPPATWQVHPTAEEVHEYLHAYAMAFDVRDAIRLQTRVESLEPGWRVNGEPFDAVVVASGRFRAPERPSVLDAFSGRLLHAFDYPGAEPFRDGTVLVYGNGVSGHEIASDLASHAGRAAPVISAYRKARYVLQKNVAGVPSDWQWYTQIGALRRATMSPHSYAQMLRARVVRVAGHPADFGAPAPDDDILVAGHSLCQDYLVQVREGAIICRPAIAAVRGRDVEFTDGTRAKVDSIICATGYRLDIPYLPPTMWSTLGADLRLHHRTLHPDFPSLGVIGQFALQGPYLPLLELQARWIVGVWSGEIPPPEESTMRADVSAAPPAMDSHNVLAVTLAEAAGVTPDLRAHPDLAEAVLFGPMLPPRYRLDGPGASLSAAEHFRTQLAASPRPAVEPDDVEAVADLGLADLIPAIDKPNRT